MKILLYGFKPFGGDAWNISERIVKSIRSRHGLIKFIFPVISNRLLYTSTVKHVRPDVILGIGQCNRGHKIRIERTAHGHGKRVRRVSFRLRPDAISRISYDAGDYVCNFSMMKILDILHGRRAKFAFIHIPKTFNLDQATKFVERSLDAIQNRREF